MDAGDITGSAIFMYGLPESKITGVEVRDSKFSFAEDKNRIHECPAMMDDFEVVENLGVYINNAADVTMENNEIIGRAVNLCEY